MVRDGRPRFSLLVSLVASRNATIGQSLTGNINIADFHAFNITNIVGWLYATDHSAGDDGRSESGYKGGRNRLLTES